MSEVYRLANEFALIALAAAQPLVIYMIARVLKRLDLLAERVNSHDARVGKLESWKEDHSRWSENEAAKFERRLDLAMAKSSIGHDR